MAAKFLSKRFRWKRGIDGLIYLMILGIACTACGFSSGRWRDLFQPADSLSTATAIATTSDVWSISAINMSTEEPVTMTPTMTEATKTNTPSITASYTASSTETPTLTHTSSPTFTNTYVYFPPTSTQIPPTNTRIPPSNTPVPSSATPRPTETVFTESPTQEVTTEPTKVPTEEATVVPVCFTLTLTHTGEGSDPVASPKNSHGCSNNQYIAGEIITLSNAIPAAKWEIDGWIGTMNDYSVSEINYVRMPASDHSAGVIYGSVG